MCFCCNTPFAKTTPHNVQNRSRRQEQRIFGKLFYTDCFFTQKSSGTLLYAVHAQAAHHHISFAAKAAESNKNPRLLKF
jgi:hypothetical protein